MEINILAKSYLARISESFIYNKWELSSTTILILEIILIVVLLCIFFYLIQRRYQQKKELELKNPFTIKNREEIRRIFDQTLNERSKFEVSFSKKHKFFSNCSPVELKKDSIILELPANIVPTKEWNKRPVYVYFSISGRRPGVKNYYYFESEMLYFFSKSNYHFIVVKLPDILEIKQKRRHFRIEARNNDFEKVVIYFFYNQDKINSVYDLPEPVFEYKKSNKNEKDISYPISIVNISAGGIRLKITRQFKREIGFDVDNPPLILIFLSFFIEKRKINIFLLCQVKNHNEDYITKDIEIGLQFIKEGFIDPKKNNIINWKEIKEDEGQEYIARWVFLKNLSLIRKGLQ
ncbi:hypothetical protein JCM12298_17140 [Desulfothermus naphthae]